MAERRQADVCVVGAGFAGLAAARRVHELGREVVVLEARDRVGGRTWNRKLDDGTVLSVGGTWLGQRQDRMFALCSEFGLEPYPQYEEGATILRLGDGVNRRYRGLIPRINPLALASLGVALKGLDLLTRRLPLEEPWKTRGASRLDERTLRSWISSVPTQTARDLLTTTMTTFFCTDLDQVSLLGPASSRAAAAASSTTPTRDTRRRTSWTAASPSSQSVSPRASAMRSGSRRRCGGSRRPATEWRSSPRAS